MDYSNVTYDEVTRQFFTGEKNVRRVFLPDEVYSQALDATAPACVDVLVVYDGKVLLGKRQQEPQPHWWVVGGKMIPGETYGEAAARNMLRELGFAPNIDRLNSTVPLGLYSLVWNTRAQAPVENGCHMFSNLLVYRASWDEVSCFHPNEEYSELRWVDPQSVLDGELGEIHPALRKMLKDYLVLKQMLLEYLSLRRTLEDYPALNQMLKDYLARAGDV